MDQQSLAHDLAQIQEQLPALVEETTYSDIWGVDLINGKPEHIKAVLTKFLAQPSTLPSMAVERACVALKYALKWRPRAVRSFPFDEVPELSDFIHICRHGSRHTMWILLDERTLKLNWQSIPQLSSYADISRIVRQLAETLVETLLKNVSSADELNATLVIDCRPFYSTTDRSAMGSFFRDNVRESLCGMISSMVKGYPELLSRLLVINPPVDIFCNLPLPDGVLRKTAILKDPKEVAGYLGDEVPLEYGGKGKPLAEIDCLAGQKANAKSTQSTDTPIPIPRPPSSPKPSPKREVKTHFSYSKYVGFPSVVLGPEDLAIFGEIVPGKFGAHVKRVFHPEMVVKYGPDVRLAEAEAMHLIATTTTIPIPKLLGAYILDDVCYIVMEFVEGELLRHCWDKASSEKRDDMVSQLKDAVDQMRAIKGTYIGGMGSTPSIDPIFTAGFNSLLEHDFGPYDSEAAFNEGLVYALENSFAPGCRRAIDPGSSVAVGRYINAQLARSLKGHEIVFTHGDLRPENVIVRPDGTVVIIDWGMSGYYPEYWEYFRLMVSIPFRVSWDLVVEKYIPPYYAEAALVKRLSGVIWN